MSSHVARRNFGLSKLLFIALVALYVVFGTVNAADGDDVAVDAEGGEAVAERVDGGDAGESQAGAEDVIRSAMNSSQAQSASGNMQIKKDGPNKLKIGIIIVVVLLAVAAVSTAVGTLVIAPKVGAYRAKTTRERMHTDLPAGYEWGDHTFIDGKKKDYIYAPNVKQGDDLNKTALEGVLKTKLASKVGKQGSVFISTKGDAQKKALEEHFKLDKIDPAVANYEKLWAKQFIEHLVYNDIVAVPHKSGLLFMDKGKMEAPPAKKTK